MRDCPIVVDNVFYNFDFLYDIKKYNTECFIICFVLTSNNIELARRFNYKLRHSREHVSLYPLDKFFYNNKLSNCQKIVQSEDFSSIVELLKDVSFGDYVFYINTDEIEHKFKYIVEKILEKIKETEKKYEVRA